MGVIARYREYLPVGPSTPEVDLHEGSTPLVPSRNIGRALGLERLFFKYEGLNPTGSFKDRGMVNKLSQALMYGAKVVALKGTFDTALDTVRELTSRYPVALMNSVNPNRLEGQKTAAFEIVDALGDAPDYLLLPVGNAGNITAYWKGFREYHKAGRSTRLPRMVGAQAEGAAPIVAGHPIPNPRTVASAIRIGNPASWEGATSARDESGGLIAAVTDTEILSAQIRLANTEGLFAEPASAAPLALLIRLVMEGKIEKDSTTVVVLTGSGLKDPDAALKNVEPPIELDGDARTLAKVLKL